MPHTQAITDTDLGALRFERIHDEPGVFWGHTRSVFRCYERGVELTVGKARRRLLFADVAGLAFGLIDHLLPTGYGGTQYHLELHPTGGEPGSELVFDCITTPIKKEGRFWSWTARTEPTRVNDPELEGLRDELSLPIARRMLAALESAGSVEWAQGVIITPTGLTWGPTKPARGELPFAEIEKVTMVEGSLYLFRQGVTGWVVKVDAIAVNFYPGLRVLHHLAPERFPG